MSWYTIQRPWLKGRIGNRLKNKWQSNMSSNKSRETNRLWSLTTFNQRINSFGIMRNLWRRCNRVWVKSEGITQIYRLAFHYHPKMVLSLIEVPSLAREHQKTMQSPFWSWKSLTPSTQSTRWCSRQISTDKEIPTLLLREAQQAWGLAKIRLTDRDQLIKTSTWGI